VNRPARRDRADVVEGLIRRHWHGAYRAAYLILQDAGAAEDATQEAMLAAVRGIDRFDRRRSFAPWLHRIVVNRALDRHRADVRRPESPREHLEIPASLESGASEALSPDLAAALAELDREQRAIVVLRHVFGYNSREIARMLDLPAATVRTHLRRALDQLRTSLDESETRA
jgi:RNA polymerase sigma-70 factor, ECF subfamily